eukprot:PhF_6_TR39000/c0_g1_i1/m.58363/K15272/SLC35A1_2_3; solute carrier family 35 (UDP-sugar transporter), member A1/2/3
MVSISVFILTLLVLQNSCLVLTTHSAKNTYNKSTILCIIEFMKFALLFIAVAAQCNGNIYGCFTKIAKVAMHRDTIRLAIPAVLYTMQNYFFHYSLTHLSAVAYYVLSQSKIVATAILSVVWLRQSLSRKDLLAISGLILGVLVHQLGDLSGEVNPNIKTVTTWNGILAVLISSVASSIACIYQEKICKQHRLTLIERNIQLLLSTLPLALMTMLIMDGIPWYTFDPSVGLEIPLTWVVIFLQAFGGFIVGAVLLYSSNVSKGFATRIAILVASGVEVFVWGHHVSGHEVLGGAIVLLSTWLYAS